MKLTEKQRTLLLTSLVCLLPLVMSVVVYKDLPDRVAIHWDSSGKPDNFASKAFAAFGLPFVMFGLNVFSKLYLLNDPKRENISQAAQLVANWLPPLLSVILVPVTLLVALGRDIQIALVAKLILGVTLILVGNYLPKSRQNYTVGIKIPWTLADVDNWNKTHRFAGYLYIASGFVLLGEAFIPGGIRFFDGPGLTVSLALVLAIAPSLYSYWLFKKSQGKAG
ncbi:MAG: DUF1648 domain-containing protein [Bacillota bacterium]|nr:DUF1648 domain-containing protein [Bacillota bacterium]